MAYKLHFLMMIAIFESERFDTNLYYNKSRAATIVFLLFLKRLVLRFIKISVLKEQQQLKIEAILSVFEAFKGLVLMLCSAC